MVEKKTSMHYTWKLSWFYLAKKNKRKNLAFYLEKEEEEELD